jgi:predicted nuclease of predicted toxin-antitoxin system
LAQASDTEIWNYAISVGAAIVTKDEDFAQRKVLHDGGPAVVWIRLPNTRRRDLLIWFDGVFSQVVQALGAVDSKDFQMSLIVIQDCFWRGSHGRDGAFGAERCGLGADCAADHWPS